LLSRSDPTEAGVTLVGVLIVVVLIGAVCAGAVLGLSAMTGSGTAKRTAIDASSAQACRAVANAARSAATVYFADGADRMYPTTWSDLTESGPPYFQLAPNVVVNEADPKELDSSGGWKLVMTGGGPRVAEFACS